MREEVRRELREELTMRELGKTLHGTASPAALAQHSPIHALAQQQPLHASQPTHAPSLPLSPPSFSAHAPMQEPPKLNMNSSPVRYRTALHTPLFPSSSPSFTASPAPASMGQRTSPTRTRSPIRAHHQVSPVSADWRRKSPSRYFFLFPFPTGFLYILC